MGAPHSRQQIVAQVIQEAQKLGEGELLAVIRDLDLYGQTHVLRAIQNALTLEGEEKTYLRWYKLHLCSRCRGKGFIKGFVIPDPKWVDCPDCDGKGYLEDELGHCERCQGEGKIQVRRSAKPERRNLECPVCHGRCLAPGAAYAPSCPYYLPASCQRAIREALDAGAAEPPPPERESWAGLREAQAKILEDRHRNGEGLWHPADLLPRETFAGKLQRGTKRIRNGHPVPQPAKMLAGKVNGLRVRRVGGKVVLED